VLPKMSVVKTLATVVGIISILPASALADCGPGAGREPDKTPASLKAARNATLCLINEERSARGLNRLRFNHKLTLAGLRHARDMVSQHYFSHDALSGEDFVQRILDTHYASPSASFSLAENLAWGTLDLSSPRETVKGWMNSAGHRRNILDVGFRELGIGIAIGDPTDGHEGGATYAAEFGTVHRR
jgi:uncharacterized protein YkwD